jgi:AcrR family transcriptional regulator
MVGLRERKKLQTRIGISEAARRLFDVRGFEAVTVAEIARAADVSEVTVFNYFPTKEDLFYAGMHFFEEELIEAVVRRPVRQSALAAFRRRVLEGGENLGERERAAAILKAGRHVAGSASLRAREREIVDEYIARLAGVLAAETGSAPDDVEPAVAAASMMAAHRTLVAYVRARVSAGRRGPALVEDFRGQARRAFARLEKGLGGYAVRA